jgi:catechol 2,3-dioxygenase-like lactoylglutathione lyase family enzyme
MLQESNVIAFVATADPDKAKLFYSNTLGLRLVDETPFALEFDAHGTMLRIQIVETLKPAQHTVLGWRVDDIATAAKELTANGATFERFEGMPQDELGVWNSPGGAKVAWFKDPDGNVLSLTEFE